MKNKVNLTLEGVLIYLNDGIHTIRKTSGLWNNPERDGKIVTSADEIKKFWNWAAMVEVFYDEDKQIIDLHGYSSSDMF